MYNYTKDTPMKEEDHLAITTRPINEEQNMIELGILWGGFLIAFVITAVHMFRSHQTTHSEEGSSGDANRSLFYKLLGIALLSRLLFIPISVYCEGDMFQLVADTLPQLTFASAWALLVAFFAQLVGTATGTVLVAASSSPRPSPLIHVACYITYVILVILYWWNDSAAVLLEAGLCCLYAALFGTLIYFGPKLVVILHPSLERQSGLAVRLVSSCSIGCVVFILKSISLGRTVVVPASTNPPWYIYGVLELLPTYLLLVMMHSSSSKETNIGETMRPISSNTRGRVRSAGEMSSLLKPQPPYGSKEGP
jgi:putative Ca2+/H+ antiporter (TMEM165/GDT1 family)